MKRKGRLRFFSVASSPCLARKALCGSTNEQLQKLQRIQNHAARLICRIPKYNNITPVLKTLHWLPIKARIEFKLAVICYRCNERSVPPYISDLLKKYTPTRRLRSETQNLFEIPKTKSTTYGNKSFSYMASITWNNLPSKLKQCKSLQSFKTSLKTYLFRKYFH